MMKEMFWGNDVERGWAMLGDGTEGGGDAG